MQKQSSRRGFGTLAGALVGVLLLSALPAIAHHGWGGYLDQDFELSGTLETPVSVAGPHASTKIRAADGKVWNIVLAPPNRTQSAGLKEGIIPVGAKVTVQGHRHRDANVLEVKTARLTWGNRVFNVYPDR